MVKHVIKFQVISYKLFINLSTTINHTGLFLSDRSFSLSKNPASVSTYDWPATVI